MNEEVINLPPYFKQLEYLESKGSQYIDTGYIPNNETGLYLKVYRINGGDLVPAGSRTNNIRFYPPRFNMNSISIEYGWGNYYNIGNRDTNDNLSYESWLNFCNSRKTSIQTQSKFYEANLSTTLSTISHTIYIFDWNYNGSPTTHWAGKIYRVKISQGDTIVKDFVPALNLITNKPCMFDLITQTAYYNQGSGEFAYYYKEPIISIPYGYKRCTFLESTGTQYINTNYVATNNTGAYVKWSLTNIKNYSNVLSSLGINTDDTADSGFIIPHWNGDNSAYLSVFMSRSENVLRLENQTAPTLYSVHKSYLNYYNNSEAYIDTTLMGSVDNTYENLENDLPLYLFGCNKLNSLSTNDSMIGRIYRTIITEGEEVVMDLIPCLDNSGKPCMYDLVTQTPFYNANAEGNDFRYVIKGKIPSWYKRVEHLESTGTQYIKTGYVPTNITGLYIDTRDVGNGDTIPMGLRESSSTNTRFFITRQTTSYSAGYGWGTWTEISTTKGSVRYDSTLNWLNDRKSITNNPLFGTIIKNLGELPFTPSLDIWMFGINQGVSHAYKFKGRIYRAKISQGTEIVRDFVPTLDENGVPCMFDLIEGIPYYNAGSGEFLYNKGIENYTGFGQLSGIGNRLGGGTDGLPPAYTRVNYLESTGTQYIDTGIVTDGTYTICAKMNLSWNSAWGRAYKTSDYDIGGCSFCRRTTISSYYCLNFLYYWSGGIYPNRPNFTDVEWDFNEANVFEAKEGTTSVLINGKKSNIHGFNELKVDTSNPNNLSHYVFWANGVFSNGNGKGVMKLYNFSIKDGSEKIVLDFIPCLDDNGRPCMFDRVSKKPFYNSGTGEFLYG